MGEEIKKIEELDGFKNMRIVDNFYHKLLSYAYNSNWNIK